MFLITKKRLDSASLHVTYELRRLGFYDDLLHDVDVFLVWFGHAFGWQNHHTDGSIDIPRVSLGRIQELLGRRYISLRDVLRHEYAHALAHTHPWFIETSAFRRAFDADYGPAPIWAYDPSFHITEYAASSPQEDFSECFMCYVRWNGKLPKRYQTKSIIRKWWFIYGLKESIALGSRRITVKIP